MFIAITCLLLSKCSHLPRNVHHTYCILIYHWRIYSSLFTLSCGTQAIKWCHSVSLYLDISSRFTSTRAKSTEKNSLEIKIEMSAMKKLEKCG